MFVLEMIYNGEIYEETLGMVFELGVIGKNGEMDKAECVRWSG